MTRNSPNPTPELFPDINPRVRPRRLRGSAARRQMVAETRLDPSQLIIPHFVLPGVNQRQPIQAMPGQSRVRWICWWSV